MDVQPLVSIITPTYNHERFIGACIESVLAQTYSNWEMLIVDDGSTDRTSEIVQEYARRDTRIRAFHQENKGIWRLSETYNFALQESNGELIAVLEGDDLWVPRKLELQVPVHIGGGYAISFGRMEFVDTHNNIINDSWNRVEKSFLVNSDPTDRFFRHLRGEYGVPALTVLISRDALRKIGGFLQPEYLPLVDYPTWISIGGSFGYGYIPEILGYWRQFDGQTTWQLSRDIARGVYRFATEYYREKIANVNGMVEINIADLLLSQNRRRFLADASYRAAAVAGEKHELRQSWMYCQEIVYLGHYRLFVRCIAMIGWKCLRYSSRGVLGRLEKG